MNLFGIAASPRIYWALVFAASIIISAFLFKGSPNITYVEGALIGAALGFVILKPRAGISR
ncbi:hypothetical protein [Granulicella arctica]|uniref:hypothetical protein n=1 Tax=Granulicella arctica TaxID=940613 RepID=UPI0021E02F84|nr:hypothetical protein [Granulicella arctica]